MTASNSLSVGDPAPDFILPATNGQNVHLYEELEKASVVLFFYLKAFTPVCTAEACSFREKMDQFDELDALVYGVSSDSVTNAERFAKHNRLSFPLLSDADGEVRALYRVPKALGLLPGRSTYVIGGNKKIRNVTHSQLGAQAHVSKSLQSLNGDAR